MKLRDRGQLAATRSIASAAKRSRHARLGRRRVRQPRYKPFRGWQRLRSSRCAGRRIVRRFFAMNSTSQRVGILALAIAAAAAAPAAAQPAIEAKNIEQLSRLDLAGNGDGGEGLAL